MWISIGNVNAEVSRASPEETEWLRSPESGLAYTDKSAIHRTGKPGLKRFYDLVDRVFPAGFLPLVRKRAAEAGLDVQVIDNRTPPCPAPGRTAAEVDAALRLGSSGAWLRDYQSAAVAAALTATRGIIKVPTGGGKTEIAAALTLLARCRWLFLVHRTTLMAQAAERFEKRTGEVAGRIGEGAWTVGRFTVATFQSLTAAAGTQRLKALIEQTEGLLVDECHVLPANTFYGVASSMRNAYWRLGLSGTPLDREDRRSVMAVAALGPIVYEIRAQRLIAEGRLARPVINLIRVRQEFDERDEYGLVTRWPWAKVYREGVVRSLERNRALIAATQRAERPCLVFVKDLVHGRSFAKALQKRGVRADFVWGTHSLRARQDAVRRLERGDLEVLVCSVIFQEGVDIPALRSVVVASGGKSVIAALQRLGRGMRRTDGKETFEVWDVADTGNEWLAEHAAKRRRAYQREGYAVAEVAPVVPKVGGQQEISFPRPGGEG